MGNDTTDIDINEDKLLTDIIQSLTREYDISEEQIKTGGRNIKGCVTLKVHSTMEQNVDDFPGFGHSSVKVFEMTDEPLPGYVPKQTPPGQYKIRLHTEEAETPQFE